MRISAIAQDSFGYPASYSNRHQEGDGSGLQRDLGVTHGDDDPLTMHFRLGQGRGLLGQLCFGSAGVKDGLEVAHLFFQLQGSRMPFGHAFFQPVRLVRYVIPGYQLA